MEIHLVTHNKNKVAEFRHYLEPEISVIHVNLECPEIRAETNDAVAKHAAKEMADLLKKPIVVEDSGFFITALEGFPGVYTSTVSRKIGNRGFLKLMVGVQERTVHYRSAVAYCEPDHMPHVFMGEEEGVLAEEERGSLGWGQDTLFIPNENNPGKKTYGELRQSNENLFRSRAVLRLKEFLLGKTLKERTTENPT